GTHHSAQKSTRTGVSDDSTTVWKSSSPTEPMFAIRTPSISPRGEPALGPQLPESLAPYGHSRSGAVVLLGQEPLGIDRVLAPLACRRHGLTIRVVGDLTWRHDHS